MAVDASGRREGGLDLREALVMLPQELLRLPLSVCCCVTLAPGRGGQEVEVGPAAAKLGEAADRIPLNLAGKKLGDSKAVEVGHADVR